MTTFEKFYGLVQVVQNLEGLRRDMRVNAQTYIDRAASGQYTAPQIAAVARGDAAEYQRRLGWVAAIPAQTRADLLAFAAGLGIADDITAGYTELKTAADTQASATLNTLSQVTAGGNWVLANVAAHWMLW